MDVLALLPQEPLGDDEFAPGPRLDRRVRVEPAQHAQRLVDGEVAQLARGRRHLPLPHGRRGVAVLFGHLAGRPQDAEFGRHGSGRVPFVGTRGLKVGDVLGRQGGDGHVPVEAEPAGPPVGGIALAHAAEHLVGLALGVAPGPLAVGLHGPNVGVEGVGQGDPRTVEARVVARSTATRSAARLSVCLVDLRTRRPVFASTVS